MRIHLISIGNKMPQWIGEGYREYAKRLPGECALILVEIAAGHRCKGADIHRAIREEGERMLAAIPKGALVVALDVLGKPWSTELLAEQLGDWMHQGRDVALLVGGPEGLCENCLAMADLRWSLSALTFPHPLVRVILAEQLYRAWTLLRNHPYHRA
ncbi:MAG: 23S rRNA (pseudouridine(1915)-N(3))-methyltransferase RlmH [Gammaproteobacteria bacterium]|nr:23S rRNA (pseudouridine(1915)-N(3))-methyltransferase RlmH [Gammaproteobacteria bacterium]MBU1653947.1 23S rRNA (pseudouridine(1915)-N(3))-methyltransferase RlmH [Gammaproteobacteria bacterium]MBU1962647.1 23S rRNA (pseudouridine(1915)-N(3))-methyltransferase RlmH [Gammaproteobacteria bacterium]